MTDPILSGAPASSASVSAVSATQPAAGAPAPHSGPLHVLVDGRPVPVDEGTTLAALVASLSHDAAHVTTAVNGRFVARPARDALTLRHGDSVVLFQPIVGG